MNGIQLLNSSTPRFPVRVRRTAAALVGLLATPCFISASGFQDDVLTFGGDAAYPPFEWLDDGEPSGVNVDLQRAIAEVGGVRADHRLGNWPDVIRGLESGSIDVVAMFKSAEREQQFRFTQPFDFVNHAIYGLDGSSSVTSIEDLSTARVAVEELSYAHLRLRESGSTAEFLLTPNTITALEAVEDERADYAILGEVAADYLIRSRDLDLRSIGPRLWPAEYVLAVRKDRQALGDWLNDQLTIVMESGRYREIQEGWARRPENGWQTYAVVPLAILVLLAAWYLWSMRKTQARHAHRLVDESRLRELAESQLRWTEDHFVDTEMPRAHRFVSEATAALAESNHEGQQQVVALKLADLDRTIRTDGHEAGQKAVRQFAKRLRAANFTAYGQLGRDVFAIFGSKAKIAKEFRSVFFSSDTATMKTPVPSAFAGAATWPQHGSTLSELLRKAESALDYATRRRERWVDFRSFMEPKKADLDLVAEFREKAGNVIYPVFQPQVDLASGKVVGAEALARWKSSDRDVSPGVFVPVLEDAGLIQHVTRTMITQAVRVSADLRKRGTPCPMSVNVTARDLLGWKLSRHIFAALREYGGLPEHLKLELTETTVVERPEVLRWKMKRLVQRGVKISIDDFGTGYSSLSHLSNFPVEEIKVDQSFVLDMLRNDRDLRIVTSTISMGHELGLIVVAEGVETEDALNVLREHHCDRVQGYVISRPIPEAEFLEFIAHKEVAICPQEARPKVTAFRRKRRGE